MEIKGDLEGITDYMTARKSAAINAVGWLQEYCVRQVFKKDPVYEGRMQRQWHIYTCSLNGYQTEGLASNKKDAKSEAAAMMLNLVDPKRIMLNVKASDHRRVMAQRLAQRQEALKAEKEKKMAEAALKLSEQKKKDENIDHDFYEADQSGGQSFLVMNRNKFGPVDWTLKKDPEDVPTSWEILNRAVFMKQVKMSVISKDNENGSVQFAIMLGDSIFTAEGDYINEARETASRMALKYYEEFNAIPPKPDGPLQLRL